MDDHLPECIQSPGEPVGVVCICWRLRAAEQRVRDEEHRALITHGARTNLAGYSEGYAAGVQAARDAVAALLMAEDPFNISVYDAIAAIDGLVKP